MDLSGSLQLYQTIVKTKEFNAFTMARLLCTVSYKIPIQKEDIGTMQRDSGLSQGIFITIIERLG